MTVAELISELQKIEDKNKEVRYSDWDGATKVSVTRVTNRNGVVELYFYR